MTTLIEQVFEEEATISKDANDNISIHQYRNALPSKERKIRAKCHKVLKRKLKKYKLRQDGKEDQDILDVSGILESSLLIKSPFEAKSSAELELEQLRPTNYLFKMGKRKQAIVITESSVKPIVTESNENDVQQSSPTLEDKKQTNAFKLLMDSRNKSLGRNSPGKEKPIEASEKLELLEKKFNKAKRSLLLQKMAETKGSLKKKELDENQTKQINKKMEKRAERLKCLISNIEPKDEKEVPKIVNGRNPLHSLKTEKNEKFLDKTVKNLQLVNMFSEIECPKNREKKEISKEDAEFLKKLSPSLKKKESMLSYFKKVDNEPDFVLDNENDNLVIKVKLGTKPKKKGKKKRLSLNRDNKSIDLNPNEYEIVKDKIKPKNIQTTKTDNKEISGMERKRKRHSKVAFCDDAAVSSSNILASSDDGRSRRNAKRPVRYKEDVALTSSDEELHVFTPKKKKHSNSTTDNDIIIVDLTPDQPNKNQLSTKSSDKPAKSTKCNLKPKDAHKGKSLKNPVKLAPIFASKSQLDTVTIEAKQKFLHSGVPDKLKKLMSKQVDKNMVSNNFVKVIHIQQLDESDKTVSIKLRIDEDSSIDKPTDPLISSDFTFKMLLSGESSQQSSLTSTKFTNPQTVLQSLKEKHPRYPVYRTYRLLRGKKKGDVKVSTNYLDLDNSVEILNASIDHQNENPEQLSWSDKYKPLAASEIIGNFESIKELRKWLVSWTESDIKSKATHGGDSDSSDFCQSDGDSKDSVKSNNNLLVLSGPVGSGKTSSVYAIAAELSIKVIEVNASSRRTGKIMLQDLQEATQSHKVNRQTSSNENSQNSQKSEAAQPTPAITNPAKKRGRPKKNVDSETSTIQALKKKTFKETSESTNGSQDSARTCMSLILIDDADIVFDQDDGFCSAIVQLVQSSKRPVILITSSLSCPHLQRFVQSSKILKLNPLLPNILGTWLDIMCLADSGICWPGSGAKVLNFFKGDVRKTINYLQFYVCSQEQAISQDIEHFSQNTNCQFMNDEASNISWEDRGGEDRNLNDEPTESNDYYKLLMLQQAYSRHSGCPNALFNVWWNVPKLLSLSDTESLEKINQKDNIANNNKLKSIDSLSQVLDSLSLCDLYRQRSTNNKGNLSSDPWFSNETHSVSELENFDRYDRHYGTSNEIAHELACTSVSIAQEDFERERITDLDLPGMSQQRHKDRIVSRHSNLTSFLSPQAILDRKALALDYWSTCRSICRIEKSKTDTNSKRNNRFCHYLKSSSVLCKNDSFDKLTYSLCPSEDVVKFN